MGEIINLDEKRKEKWIRILEEARSMGKAAIFGVVGEMDATIIEFPAVDKSEKKVGE